MEVRHRHTSDSARERDAECGQCVRVSETVEDGRAKHTLVSEANAWERERERDDERAGETSEKNTIIEIYIAGSRVRQRGRETEEYALHVFVRSRVMPVVVVVAIIGFFSSLVSLILLVFFSLHLLLRSVCDYFCRGRLLVFSAHTHKMGEEKKDAEK